MIYNNPLNTTESTTVDVIPPANVSEERTSLFKWLLVSILLFIVFFPSSSSHVHGFDSTHLLYKEFLVEPAAHPQQCLRVHPNESVNESLTDSLLHFVMPGCYGGLGNQLMCLGAALAYALEYGRCLVLPSTSSPHATVDSPPYNETIFRHFWVQEHLSTLRENILKNPTSPSLLRQKDWLFEYEHLPDSASTVVVLVGLFFHYQYTWAHRKTIQAYLRPSPQVVYSLLSRYPGLAHGVAVHFRRGDFFQPNTVSVNDFPIPNSFYYSQSADDLYATRQACAPNVTSPDLTFFIFSNDLPWVREQEFVRRFPGRLVFVDENEVVSFYMMILAREGIVCANSTFCWWAMMLGLDSRPCYSPSHWYASPGQVAKGVHFPGNIVMHSTNEPGEGPPPIWPKRSLLQNALFKRFPHQRLQTDGPTPH